MPEQRQPSLAIMNVLLSSETTPTSRTTNQHRRDIVWNDQIAIFNSQQSSAVEQTYDKQHTILGNKQPDSIRMLDTLTSL